ncbi:MAG TPA: hypothetical protein VFB13_02020 [Reyranella sp.]|jgi:hypothetical protein|nr:hypothetical protein [Reyranella sp.]
MLLDNQNQFSAAQAVTSTGSTASTNVIDLGVARDIGGAVTDQLMLLCEVVTPFTSGGSATLQVQFQTSPDNSAWSTLAQSDAIPVASLVQGYKFLPGELPGGTSRYLRLNYVVGTAAMTGGAVTAALVPSLDVQNAYPRGYAA